MTGKSQVGAYIYSERVARKISRREISALMGVTEQYFSKIENDKAVPSEMFLRFFCVLLGLEVEPTLKLAGIKSKQKFNYEKAYKLAGSLVMGVGLAGPAFPVVASGILTGISAALIVTRLTEIFGTRSEKELAEKHLEVTPATISNWKSRNKIPEKYLLRAAEKTGKTIEWFYAPAEKSDGSVLAELVEMVENSLQKSEIEINSKKKGMLIDLLFGKVRISRILDPVEIDNFILAFC